MVMVAVDHLTDRGIERYHLSIDRGKGGAEAESCDLREVWRVGCEQYIGQERQEAVYDETRDRATDRRPIGTGWPVGRWRYRIRLCVAMSHHAATRLRQREYRSQSREALDETS